MKPSVLSILAFLLSASMASHAANREPKDMADHMIRAHNQIRQSLDLEGLTWSEPIAAYARQWAKHLATRGGCAMKHRPRTGKYAQRYGENIYWASPTRWSDGRREVQSIDPGVPVKRWADEAANYDYPTNTCGPGKVCGHYTQVVWRNSKQLGCAMALCPDKGQIWVCNYDPPGNYIGEKPY
uniref:Pathogenesis-related protein 1 n=1 Tax=Candidatus Kentrum sp. SD TaxID=2126332 RepID=A0A450Y975_9GAMM|nr:MAG: pathogenesis-related protein 1 [Candidatus Kentron sp. SD]VFK42840.1 MAG: pathogenesis-related protein 1 [Candidatus Kentron sp. SD]